jgi:hypothetical protein
MTLMTKLQKNTTAIKNHKLLSHFDGCSEGATSIDDMKEAVNVGMLARVPAATEGGMEENKLECIRWTLTQ